MEKSLLFAEIQKANLPKALHTQILSLIEKTPQELWPVLQSKVRAYSEIKQKTVAQGLKKNPNWPYELAHLTQLNNQGLEAAESAKEMENTQKLIQEL